MNARGTNLGHCYIFSITGRIPKDLRESIDGRIHPIIIHESEKWAQSDFYVQTASLSSKSERAAASMGATIVVLPEGMRYLLAEIDHRVLRGTDVWVFIPSRSGDTV